jgi:DnaK suppressor protein
MARRDALLRLHKSLRERRTDLLKKLTDDLNNLRNFQNGDGGGGDTADAAFESGSDEMHSHLAELDSRELTQIDRALTRLKQGTYGLCEICQSKIPVGRLNALPYTTLCIGCQRDLESHPGWEDSRHRSWENVFDAATPLEDQREVNLADLEIDLSSR